MSAQRPSTSENECHHFEQTLCALPPVPAPSRLGPTRVGAAVSSRITGFASSYLTEFVAILGGDVCRYPDRMERHPDLVVDRFVFIAKHRNIWPVAWLCEALGVSRSGFHAWLNRSPSARSRSDEAVGQQVKASFIASDRTYGARRVWRDLLADGVDCGLHRIERLMRLQALRARPRRRRLPKDEGGRQIAAVPANLLDRQFAAERPNQKWIADFTYIWTIEGWLYVAAVIDLFSRRVVGWSMSAGMTAQLVADALMMAVWRRGKPNALLHHSDQGSQYSSEQFQRLMADSGIVCSMSRSGNVWDNAAMESFFSSLKTERTAGKIYRTRNDARADVFDYIERFYNRASEHPSVYVVEEKRLC